MFTVKALCLILVLINELMIIGYYYCKIILNKIIVIT